MTSIDAVPSEIAEENPPIETERGTLSKTKQGLWQVLRSPHLRNVFLLIGLALFAFLIYRLKPAFLIANLRTVGWKFIYILAISFCGLLAHTLAWMVFLKNFAKVRFRDVLKIKLAGEAISNLTPLTWAGGDPARILMLKNHIRLSDGTASVVVDRTLNGLGVALFMIIGIFITFIKFSLPTTLKVGLLVALSVMIAASSFFYVRSHEGLLEFFLDLMKKLRIKSHFSEKTVATVQRIDASIANFYRMNKKGFFVALGLHFSGKICSVFEIMIAGSILGHGVSFLESYVLLSMTVVVNMIFSFVPGSIGVLEGAFAGSFALVNLNPVTGTSIQILRRLRMLFWTGVGFVFAALIKRKSQNLASPT